MARNPRRVPPAPDKRGSLEILGTWFGRHSTLYASASLITLALGFIQVAIVTRLLVPAEYGRAGLLLLYAGFLTIAYNMLTLNGTFMRAFGAAEEADVAVDDPQAAQGDTRRVLGTGIATTLAIAIVGTLVALPLAPTLAQLLVGDASSSGLVLLAVASGGFGALWRLLQNIPRMELKPGRYAALSVVRPLLVMAAITALVSSGHGVAGLVAGTAVGSGAAAMVAAVVTRHSYRFAFEWRGALAILLVGAPYVPVILSFWLVQNGDLFALSRFASQHDVGLYRLAGKMGSVAGYACFAFLTAWIPLRRTTAYAAATEEHGPKVSGTLFTYFSLLGMGLLLCFAVGADVLVRIAPPAYADAAPLIPLIAAGFLAHALLVATNRGANFPRKRLKYVLATVLSALCFASLAPFLVPALGAYGAALSVIVGFTLGTTVMLALSQRGPGAMEIQADRLLKGALAAVACLAVARSTVVTGEVSPILEGASLLLFPVLLVATGAVPREEVRALVRIARGAVGRRPEALDLAGLVVPEPGAEGAAAGSPEGEPEPVPELAQSALEPRPEPVPEARRPTPEPQPEAVQDETLDSAELRLEWRRKHGLGRLRHDPLAAEARFGEHVRYYLHAPEGARRDALVVCFSSARGDAGAGYSYVGALHDFPCEMLFVRASNGLFLGAGRSTEVREAVASLLRSVVAERNLPHEGVICCGTSLGGGAALSQAAGCGFVHAVVGLPIVLIGETLLGEFGGKQGAEMAKLLAGGADDDREYLNSIIPGRLAEASSETTIHLLTSEKDPLHAANVTALRRAVEANDQLSLDVTLSDYGSHAEIRRMFPAFLRQKVAEILSLPASMEPAAELPG